MYASRPPCAASFNNPLALELLIGAGRAAVSQHLNKLGKRVYYHLTGRGDKLLALFDGQIR
jgi:hypothetical protein